MPKAESLDLKVLERFSPEWARLHKKVAEGKVVEGNQKLVALMNDARLIAKVAGLQTLVGKPIYMMDWDMLCYFLMVLYAAGREE